MGLDSLINEIGHVHSSKDAEDLEFSRDTWKAAMMHEPVTSYTLVTRDDSDKDTIKFFIEVIDEMLEGDYPSSEGDLTEDQERELDRWRDDLVEVMENRR